MTGNHHRYRDGAVAYVTDQGSSYAAYGSSDTNSHRAAAGNGKAATEFVPLLNVAYHLWKGEPVNLLDLCLPLSLRGSS